MRDHPGLVESCLVDVSIFLNFQKLRKNSIYIKYVSSQKRESKLAGIKFILFRTRNRIRASIKLYLFPRVMKERTDPSVHPSSGNPVSRSSNTTRLQASVTTFVFPMST